MNAAFNLFSGISDVDYHGDRASLSSTGARKLLACPARFRWERDNPPPSTRAFDLGKLAHRLILGEGSPILVVEAVDWRSKAAQEQRAAAYDAGVVPVLRAEYEAALAMRDAVWRHDTAAELFEDGAAELSGYWRDEPTDVRLRFRPDWMTGLDDRAVCVDAKTTVSADPAEFARSVVKFGYHMQAAWYLEGLRQNGIDDAAFLFVCIEKAPPHLVSVIELDAEAVAEGAYQNRRAIDLYAQCVATDTWPAYGHNIHTLSLPPWATRASLQSDANALIAQLEGITA